MLEHFREPRPVFSLSKTLDADERAVKDMLFALRSLGILRDVRGYRRSLICEVDAEACAHLKELLPVI